MESFTFCSAFQLHRFHCLPEEMKGEKYKQEKGKQRARIDMEDEEVDAPAELEGDKSGKDENGGSGSRRGAKRRRLTEDGESRRASGSSARQHPQQKTFRRDVDGYIPGSIVRIQLRNFLTYDFVEFQPGPYLNMIVGPNGTGKSTIVCAIALGLNSPPSILGRAAALNSFVKNGTSGGHVEIELKGPTGRQNVVVRRTLNATSKSSHFSLNGVSASGKEVNQKMMELNVEIENLCSFLPQDKVSEFAAMSSQQFLRETQRAAGDESLTSWHNTLISAGKELKLIRQQIKEEQEQLKQLTERNEGIERAVKRYNERKKIEHEIAYLNVFIPMAAYREIRIRFKEVRANKRELREKAAILEARNAPAHDLLKMLDASYQALGEVKDEKKKLVLAKLKRMRGLLTADEELKNDAENINSKIDQLKEAEKGRISEIRRLGNDIKKQEEELAKDPPELPTIEELNDESRQINLERQSLIMRRSEIDEQMEGLSNRKAEAEHEYEKGAAELKKLDNVDARKLNMMSRWDKDTHDTIKWLRKNKGLFKMEVFEPPFMSVTVKDNRYTNAVEACFSARQMKTFVTQCQEDCDTLNYHINDEKAFGRKALITTWYRARQEDRLVPPPMTPEELSELSFDGYALDYLDYPEGLQWFLKIDLNLHRTAIALKANVVDVQRAMEVVARRKNHPGGATFVTDTTMHIVSRSFYGRKAISNMTRDVPPARNFIVPAIDPETKQRYNEMMEMALQEKQLCDAARKELDLKLKAVEEEDKCFEARNDSIKSRRKAITAEQTRIVTAQSRLNRLRNLLEHNINLPSAYEQRKELKKQLLSNTQQRLINTREFRDLAHGIIPEGEERARMGLQYYQMKANMAALQELCNKKDERFQTALAKLKEVEAAFKKIEAESKQCYSESRQILDRAPEDIQREIEDTERARTGYEKAVAAATEDGLPLPDPDGVDLRSREQLQAELERQNAKLDLNFNTDPGIVEQYEKRKRDIEQLEKTIAEWQKKANKVERDITNAKKNWQPALEKLVARVGEKFSAAFDRINCAGEIRIREDEDYDSWAIDILVKFRDTEKLQLLTRQRQSGGNPFILVSLALERSLTTILYLMSLTEEARAPFSLVDEINQGMDQDAERLVHNSMVEVTCKPESAQYFLITPKLLPDLDYHERMKILCVNNGEWLPEERDLGNMMDMIEGYVHRQNRAPSAA